MLNKNLFKDAIVDAKAIREAALLNAKEALEEALTPSIQNMLAAKLNEMNMDDEEMEEGMYPEDTTDADISKPTDKFIKAVCALFMKESPIMLSNIPHKLPRDVLPPKGNHGLFTKWMEQVPGCQKQVIPCSDISRKQFMYWISHDNIMPKKSKDKICFQKQRGKPCNLNDKGECKYCK